MRKKPYSEKGISRVPCQRCGQPSKYQWQICATNSVYMGLCFECDISLNRTVIEFMGIDINIADEYERKSRKVKADE